MNRSIPLTLAVILTGPSLLPTPAAAKDVELPEELKEASELMVESSKYLVNY